MGATYGQTVDLGSGAGAGAGSAGYGFEQTTTTTTTTTKNEFGLGGEGGASFGIEGGDNEGTVGYGTSVIAGAEAGGASFGMGGGDLGSTGGEFISTGGEAFQTTTSTTTSSAMGLPSVPSNELVSTMNPDFLPGPYISAVKE